MIYLGDWENIDICSDEYYKLRSKYREAFDKGLPLELLPKDITMEELRKEIELSITEGIDLYSKYRPDDNSVDNQDDLEFLKDIKLY